MSSTKSAHSSILNVALFQLQVGLHRLMVPSDTFASDTKKLLIDQFFIISNQSLSVFPRGIPIILIITLAE
mgnify:CR=1